MKNFIAVIFMCSCLCSCKLMRLTSAEDLQFKTDNLPLILNDGLFVKVNIDDTFEKFLFDTGASSTIVFDTTLIKNFSQKERISMFNATDPNGKVTTFYTPANIETEMYSFKNQLVTVLTSMKNECTQTYFTKGIIGSGFLNKSINQNYLLDFDNLTLHSVSNSEQMKNYSEIKSKFFGNHFAIYLTVNGMEELFLFDTGNLAYPLIIGTNSQIKTDNFTEYLGSENVVVSGNLETNTKYSNNNVVTVGNLSLNSAASFLSIKMEKYNNVGLNFIKYFNWNIDYKREKVFFIKNNIPFTTVDIVPKYKYLSMIANKKLKIISKIKGDLMFNVNEVVISVNDQKVTAENMCAFQELLNSTNNWKDINVVTEKE